MADKLIKMMQDEDVQYVDLRFTDPRGKMQHVTFHKGMVEDDFFSEGQMFDGSSVAGWKASPAAEKAAAKPPRSTRWKIACACPALV